MFIKLTRSGGHSYLQLVESYRNEEGKPRQRTVATLGRLDETGGGVDSLLNGLLRAKGLPASAAASPQVEFESALALGDVWALDQLWKELGFDALHRVFRKARYTTPVEHAIRVMVFNRLCDTESKLGVLRWLQTVSIPDVDVAGLTHQHLLRSMDALMDHPEGVDGVVTGLLRPLVDQDLSLVFYDLTTISVSWSSYFAHPDRLCDCRLMLEGIGWQVAQFGVQTHVVVETDDVVGDVVRGLSVVGVVALPHPLHLQIQEEALHHGVIPAVALAAHAADQAVFGQQRLMHGAGVLAAAIRVDDQPRRWSALYEGQLQRPAHQPRLHVRRHRPAHHLARKQVQHHRQIQPTAARTDVGDVSHPGLIGLRRVELPIQHVGRDRQRVFAVGRVDELALPRRAKPVLAHQTA